MSDIVVQKQPDVIAASKKHRFIVIFLSWFFESGEVDLFLREGIKPGGRNSKCSRPFKPANHSGKHGCCRSFFSKRHPLSWLITSINHYLLFKFCCIIYVQFRQDLILKNPLAQLKPNATIWQNRCAIKSDLDSSPEHEQQLESLAYWRSWQEILGSVPISLTGTYPILLSWLVTFQLIITIIYLHYHEHRLISSDVAQFLINPKRKWHQMRQELELIANKHVQRYIMAVPPLPKDGISRAGETKKFKLEKLPNALEIEHRTEQMFRQQLRSVCDNDLAKPANMSDKWHEWLFDMYFKVSLTWTLLNASVTFIMASLLVIFEVTHRAEFRFNKMQCSAWQSLAVPIREELVALGPLQNQSYQRLYQDKSISDVETNEPSLLRLVWLGTMIELPIYMTCYRWLGIVELVSSAVFVEIVAFFYISIFFFGFIDKLTWIKQLELQVSKTFDLLISRQLGRNANCGQPIGKQEAQAVEAAMISHLNYSLFKRKFGNFQATSNSIILIMLICNGQALIISYYIVSKIDAKFVHLVYIASIYFVLIINYSMGAGSHLFSRICKLTKLMSRILALMRTEPVGDQMDLMSRLWQCHLLSPAELGFHFSFNPFGVRVCFEKQILFNAYIFGLWFVLWRHKAV